MKPHERARKALGCLVKGPLGCLAFVLGAFLVSATFMPLACGRALGETAEKKFGSAFAGTLEVGEVWAPAVFWRQSARGVVLRDPRGREVARGDLEAPPLLDILMDSSSVPLLDLVLASAVVVFEPDGSTNLSRALSPIDRGKRPADRPWIVATDSHLYIALGDSDYRINLSDPSARLRLSVDHLSLSDSAATDRRPLVIRGVEGLVDLTVRGGSVESRILLQGAIQGRDGGRAVADVAIDDIDAYLRGDGAPEVTVEWRFTGVESALLDDLLGTHGLLTRVFGPSIDDLHVKSRSDRGAQRTLLRIASPETELTLRGVERGDGRIVAGERGTIEIAFAPGSSFARELLGNRGLLPLVSAPELEGPGPRGRVILHDYSLSLDGDLGALKGTVDVQLEGFSYTMAPSIREGLALSAPDGRLHSPAADFELRIADGRVHYEDLRLVADGEEVVLDGWHQLKEGAVWIDARLPAKILRDPKVTRYRLRGTWSEPELTPWPADGDPE